MKSIRLPLYVAFLVLILVSLTYFVGSKSILSPKNQKAAILASQTYTLSATASTGGSISVSPDQPIYDEGTTVNLIATPNQGYEFAGWTGDCSGQSIFCTLTMDSNKNVGANFNTSSGSSGSPVLQSPPQDAINAAISQPLIRFNRYLSGGAHTWGRQYAGASITLAVSSYAGNTSSDARLLEQIRYSLTGGNEISANGGYPAQHEKQVTAMFVLVKNTPRIWNQLTATEKIKIDLLMKAALVASAFTTSDNNPYIKAGTQQYALDGDSNLSRGWNPNYREGMIGGMLVGISYFGVAEADNILNTYNHNQFLSELQNYGLTNIHETFNWKNANPSSNAPSGTTIENSIANYLYIGSSLSDYMTIYGRLANNTYGKNVNCGLNGGAGIDGGGKIVSGCSTIPNPGVAGMLLEFDSVDAGGARSSATYAYDGYKPHMANEISLIVSGLWQKGSDIANEAIIRQNVGNIDFWYKVEKGYIGYSKGSPDGVFDLSDSDAWGFIYNRALWEDVLKPYHGITGTTFDEYTLNITSTNGTIIKSPDQTTYTSGTSVSLVALPNNGYAFSSWSGDCSGTTSTCVLTMDSDKSVTANFTQKSNTFSTGQEVELTGQSSLIAVRDNPGTSGTIIGTHTPGNRGSISSNSLNGISKDGYYWWSVDFDSGVDGWVPEFTLIPYQQTSKPGDFDNNGVVNSIDFAILVQNWNTSSPTHDLNNDGIVNSIDYVILVQNWG